ncbi:ZnMc domain-containing protein [Mycena indigotica]|uniref:ZnMc domain-containing protein n=1 Tax=Mycena indigotica TaxID=2126181 RepID=A0A8H6ST18_9AGAR|nr:ZnMc domain-containing protein [Mycena indigotica]KAF7303430.1 ZnMc domain-containing protein [Mycena indigotica]
MTSKYSAWHTCAAISSAQPSSGVSAEKTIGTIGADAGTDPSHAVITKLAQLWPPNSTITYSFIGGTVNQRNKVNKVITEWLSYANVVFQLVDVGKGTIRISFDPTLGSWSYVGTVNQSIAAPAATMNLGWVTDDTTVNQNDHGVILHEWGHVLGCMHEHQSPARSDAITLDTDAVYAYYGATQGWDKATIKAQIIDVYNSADVSNYSALDTTSIMMYFMPAKMNLQGRDIPPNYYLSALDMAYMVVNYPRSVPNSLAPAWTLEHALEVSGVDASTTKDIIAANQGHDIDTVRKLFTAFQIAARASAASASAPDSGKPAETPTTPADSTKPLGTAFFLESSVVAYHIRQMESLHVSNSLPLAALSSVRAEPASNAFTDAVGWCATDHADLTPSTGTTTGPSGPQHGITKNYKTMLWPPVKVITYGFMPYNAAAKHHADYTTTQRDSEPTAYRQKWVTDVFDYYNTLQLGVVFRKVDDHDRVMALDFSQPVNQKQVTVRVSFGPPTLRRPNPYDSSKTFTPGGWAFIGTDQTDLLATADYINANHLPGPEFTTFWLAGVPHDSDAELTPPSGSPYTLAEMLAGRRRTVYHEVGHILGLIHEQESPTSPTALPDKKLGPADEIIATLYDPNSIMLYPNQAYKNSPTTVTKLNTAPSSLDQITLHLLYPLSAQQFKTALQQLTFDADEVDELFTKAQQAFTAGLTTDAGLRIFADLRSDLAVYFSTEPRRLANIPLLPPAHDVDPGNPAHDAGGPGGSAVGRPSTAQAPGFLFELVTALKQFFDPGNNQMFTLQFPGRFLDQSSYAWDTSIAGVYGQFVKPTVVNEAEFRLVDQLYDLTDTVGGPNGTNLSIVYEQLLNNLLPRYVDNGLAQQQNQIRQWLLKDVKMSQWITDIMARQQQREQSLANAVALGLGKKAASGSGGSGTNGGSGSAPAGASSAVLGPGKMFDISSKATASGDTLNRIELSELLMNEYLYAKQDWEVERDALIRQATVADLGTPESQRALNDVTQQLAHITATRQAQLASKYADAVVRGYSHAVHDYMGYLDIASPGEALQSAKDSLREAAMSSLDGSMKVYPVQLSPLDWFEGLSTSFTMEDLTQNPEVIRQQINAKSQQLDTLNAQLVALKMGTKGDPTELQGKVDAAQTALDKAQGALALKYSSNVIAMAKTCLDAAGKVDTATLAGKLQMASSVLSDLPNMMNAVQDAQDQLTASSRALSQMLAALALAKATDTKQQQQQISLQIQALTDDLNELNTRWHTLTSSTGGVNPPAVVDHSNEAVPTTPLQLPTDSSSGGSRWQTIMFTSSHESRTNLATSNASAASEQWSCNLWIASGSGSSSHSSGASATASSAQDDNIELAFRATLVTVDRGGWFQPQFFKESAAFYKVNDLVSWVDDDAKKVKGLLPGFPTAFIIAKDIVVRITHSTTNTADNKANDAASSASSGGFLCFSYSKSSSSSSSSESASFQAYSNGYIVKIPGPQILGYIIQKTDPDAATIMPATLPTNFFIPDDEYDATVGGGGKPANGANPAHEAEPPASHAPAPGPAISEDQLKGVLAKMLDDKVGELFKQLSNPPADKGAHTTV